jgi:hypothetical protein
MTSASKIKFNELKRKYQNSPRQNSNEKLPKKDENPPKSYRELFN